MKTVLLAMLFVGFGFVDPALASGRRAAPPASSCGEVQARCTARSSVEVCQRRFNRCLTTGKWGNREGLERR